MKAKANIFIDLEGTVVDDLESCTFLENNCNKIKRFIKRLPIKDKTINVFTWGLLERSSIDDNFKLIIKNIEKKLNIAFNRIIVKEDSLKVHADLKGIDWELIDCANYEMEMYDIGFTKEQSFIEMFKKNSINNPYILIDDCIEESKSIVFHDKNKFFFEVPPLFPNITLLNPKNL